MTDPTSPVTPRRAAFIFIFLTSLLNILAMGIVIPVLQIIVKDLLGGDTARASQLSGVFALIWGLMQFVFAPMLGALSDRYGRRPIILLTSFGLGFDYILMALAPNLWWLFVGRIISGITSASTSTAGAYIADVTPPEKRAARFGMLGAAFGIGFVVGPAIGGVLGELNPRLPFWVAAVLSLVSALYGLFVLPESLPAERRTAFDWRRANPVGALKLLGTTPELLKLSSVQLLCNLAKVALPSVFVLYADYRYGWTERTIGFALSAIGLCSMVVQGGLVQPFVKSLGDQHTLRLGLAFGAASFAIFGLAETGNVFLLGIPLVALWGICGATSQSLMTGCVSPSEQGQLQGALSSLMGIAGVIGPGIFTMMFSYFIEPTSAVHLPGAPFLLTTLLLVFAMGVAWRLTSQHREAPASSTV